MIWCETTKGREWKARDSAIMRLQRENGMTRPRLSYVRQTLLRMSLEGATELQMARAIDRTIHTVRSGIKALKRAGYLGQETDAGNF